MTVPMMLPPALLFTDASTRNFLNDVGVKLATENQKFAKAIEGGSMTGPNLDSKMVHLEQSLVQKSLDGLRSSDPSLYLMVIDQANQSLNPTGAQAAAQGFFSTDAAFAKIVDKVRNDLGGKIDFANQSHREAIGNALVTYIRETGGCDVTGGRSNGCR